MQPAVCKKEMKNLQQTHSWSTKLMTCSNLQKGLSATAKFTVKTSRKFIRVFPEPDVDVAATAKFLKNHHYGYYRKAILDYQIKAVIKGLSHTAAQQM